MSLRFLPDLSTVNKMKEGMTMSTTNTATTHGRGRGRGRGGGGKDLISELPDSILRCILCSLDMTTAFETSFLSKRWRNLWTTLSVLNFSEKVYDSCSRFSRNGFMFFVEKLLLLIFRNNHTLHTFRLSHCTTIIHCDIVARISVWIHILNLSNVEVIDIQMNSDHMHIGSFELPISLFTCKSLTTLKLDFGGEENQLVLAVGNGEHYPEFPIDLPAMAVSSLLCLPALKTLHLKSLWLDKEVEKMISGCPALETLIITHCVTCFGQETPFKISNPQMKSLIIERMFHEPCKIKVVSAPKLKSFSCTDNIGFINHFSFGNVSSLVYAKIDAGRDPYFCMDDYCGDPAEFRKNAVDCLRGICNVRSLTLSALVLELVFEVREYLKSLQIKPFCNLIYLKLKTSLDKYQIGAITYLLEKCPNLKTLILKVIEVKSVSVEEEECWDVGLAPQYMMPHLKLVEIWDVQASANELKFLMFLLKNSLVLEKMIVFTSQRQPPNNFKSFIRFREKLLSFRGASSSIGILFVDPSNGSSTHLENLNTVLKTQKGEDDKGHSGVQPDDVIEDKIPTTGKTANTKSPAIKLSGKEAKSKPHEPLWKSKHEIISRTKKPSSVSGPAIQMSKSEMEEESQKRMEELVIQRQKRIAERSAAKGLAPGAPKTSLAGTSASPKISKDGNRKQQPILDQAKPSNARHQKR